jgi:hypothetical protein
MQLQGLKSIEEYSFSFKWEAIFEKKLNEH